MIFTTNNLHHHPPQQQPVYHPAIIDTKGKFNLTSFRSAFLKSIQQHRLDVTKFLLDVADDDHQRLTHQNHTVEKLQPPQNATDRQRLDDDDKPTSGGGILVENEQIAGDITLEELSDIDDEEEDDLSSSSSTSSSSVQASPTRCSSIPLIKIHADDSSATSDYNHSEQSSQDVAYIRQDSSLSSSSQSSSSSTSSHASSSSSSSSMTANTTPKKRLRIVFDLDNTLLHAVSRLKLNGADLPLEDFHDTLNRPELFKFTLPRQRQQVYYIKFRPGLREFIETVSKHCDLAIHTNATREYADVVLSIIDPDRNLFATRVAARDDDSGQNDRKDMTRLFGCADRETLLHDCLILDDRRDVWDSVYEKNIIQCNYYEYFDSRRLPLIKKYGSNVEGISFVNGVSTEVNVLDSYSPIDTKALTTADMSLADYDRQLPFLQRLIANISQKYYQLEQKVSIGSLLQEERRKILGGVVCLMTGYHRLEQPSQFGMLDNGPQHRRRLECMGARVVEAMSSEVTHVVVMRQTLSTDKARTVCGPDTKFVHNLWIYACEQTWSKVDENHFEASELLIKWSQPAARPIFDHWLHTRSYYDYCVASGRLPQPQKGLDFTTIQFDEHPSRKRPLISSSGASDLSISKSKRQRSSRQWLASGLYSDGAEVWSTAEHVILKFDPFITSALAAARTSVTT